MDRCPLCRARLRGQELCPRCGAELRLVLRTEAAAREQEARALEAIAAGDREGALRALERAALLKRHPIQGQLRGMLEQEGRRSDSGGESTDIPPILPRRWWS